MARSLLLQALRLRHDDWDPDEPPTLDGVPWPLMAADMPQEIGHGGYDLSDGAEPVGVQWINNVDSSLPPPIVFSRRSICVDVWPDLMGRTAYACCEGQNVRVGGQHTEEDRCKIDSLGFRRAPPSRGVVECNWACTKAKSCPSSCARRSLQRGLAHKLQVFKHASKGWCLRTLSFIQRGEYIMEYVAELISEDRVSERVRKDSDTDVYLMCIENQKHGASLDALQAENHPSSLIQSIEGGREAGGRGEAGI